MWVAQGWPIDVVDIIVSRKIGSAKQVSVAYVAYAKLNHFTVCVYVSHYTILYLYLNDL